MALGKVTRNEWLWAGLVALSLMFFSSIPYWLAETRQTPAWQFSGFVWGVEDGNSYIAKMRQGAEGAWTYRLAYSAEPQGGVFAFLLHLVLGKLAGTDHTALVTAYHIARFGLGLALLLGAYRFLAEFLPYPRQRRLGLFLVAVGGGLGWVLVLLNIPNFLGSLPIDVMSPEAYSFLMLSGLPHLALARLCFLLGLLAYWHRQPWWAGLAFFGVSLVQPLYVFIAWGLMALDIAADMVRFRLHFSIRPRNPVPGRPKWQVALIAAALSAPVVLYTLLAFRNDPILSQWNAQNTLTSPSFLHYLLGYGVWFVPAWLGWRHLQRRLPDIARFVALWTFALPWLIYLPIPPQRRLIEAFYLPLVACAVWGLTVAWRRWRRWLLPTFITLVSATTALIWVGSLGAANTPAEPIYHPGDMVATFEALNTLIDEGVAQPQDVVLAAYETGNVLPAYTPLIAFIGHGPETAFLAEKRPLVTAFYQANTSHQDRRAVLAAYNIRWVLFGPHERQLGDFDPSTASYLQLSFEAGGYMVYKVVP